MPTLSIFSSVHQSIIILSLCLCIWQTLLSRATSFPPSLYPLSILMQPQHFQWFLKLSPPASPDIDPLSPSSSIHLLLTPLLFLYWSPPPHSLSPLAAICLCLCLLIEVSGFILTAVIDRPLAPWPTNAFLIPPLLVWNVFSLSHTHTHIHIHIYTYVMLLHKCV